MPNKRHHVDMFGNSYEQTYSDWVTINAQQEKNNALCIENADLVQTNDELNKTIEKLEHQLYIAKYQLQRVESAARNNVVLHRRQIAQLVVVSSEKSVVIASLSGAL